ncbi:hypothetical protein J3E69DRAFT_298031 [Trichoderma sp. SZMC 28015]
MQYIWLRSWGGPPDSFSAGLFLLCVHVILLAVYICLQQSICMSLRKSGEDDLMPFVDRGAPILGAGRRRRMCASTSMIGIFLDDPAQGLLKQKSKHTAGTCFMLLLLPYKPPRVAQGPCITGHRDKKKRGWRTTAGACKSLSSPFRPLGEAEKLQHVISVRRGVECQFNAFLFSLFSLYARYSTGIHTRALIFVKGWVGDVGEKTTEVVSASTGMYARVIGPETRPDFSCDCRPRPRLPTEQLSEHGCSRTCNSGTAYVYMHVVNACMCVSLYTRPHVG